MNRIEALHWMISNEGKPIERKGSNARYKFEGSKFLRLETMSPHRPAWIPVVTEDWIFGCPLGDDCYYAPVDSEVIEAELRLIDKLRKNLGLSPMEAEALAYEVSLFVERRKGAIRERVKERIGAEEAPVLDVAEAIQEAVETSDVSTDKGEAGEGESR